LKPAFRLAAAACALATGAAVAQVTTFDTSTSIVNIPSVSVGATTYTGVTLRHLGNYVFELAGYVAEPAVAFPGTTTYDATTGVLTMPAVRVGAQTYLDVKLLNTGNYVFTLQAATELPPSVAAEVSAFARSVEALTSQAVPATGAGRAALTDLCWASNGRTRANFIADYDANAAEYVLRDAFQVGRRYENIQVLAVRNRINADNSARREIDVQWDVVYRDGSRYVGEVVHLISGSSFGTPRCNTPQTGATLRDLGNQRLAAVRARANNLREERYAISNGTAVSPQVRFRREVEFNIVDPMGNFTYAILQGPGPGNTIAGTAYPFSMKLLSPRLLRSAPELAGKPGNFLNWLDDDSFRNCTLPDGTVPVARIVDCATSGATSNSWGRGYTSTADAADEAAFAAQGWVAGGVYRVDLYNDDGWKTVNGQAGKTPVATYYATLSRLPYTFAAMQGKYPVISLGQSSGPQVAANARSATPTALALSWTRPTLQADGVVLPLNQAWEFHQGARVGNPGTALNPGYRSLARAYPGPTATQGLIPVTPALANQSGKSYTEYLLLFSEPGTGNSIRSRIQFQ
jgi:hypothetical protein